jgi:hypothetical protein
MINDLQASGVSTQDKGMLSKIPRLRDKICDKLCRHKENFQLQTHGTNVHPSFFALFL